jgi:hypothetical protein
VCPTRTLAKRACRVASRCAFRLMSCCACMYPVSLHSGMFNRMPDHSLNVLTNSSCVFKSATVDATSVASSAYHLLKNISLLEVRVYPFWRDLSQRKSGSIIRRKRSGDRGSPWSVPLKTLIRSVYPCGVWNVVCASLWRLDC